MKSIADYSYVLLLFTIVSNGVGQNPLVAVLNRMAETPNRSINGVFKPSKDGYLGVDEYNRIFKGTFIPKNMTVAMKFMINQFDCDHEYEMYTYLGAINEPDVEAHGIPAIYYCGKWKDYYIMAMTLLDPQFYIELSTNNRGKTFSEMDLLIILREYVRLTKRMHISGVFHPFIKIMDIWFRKHQGFVYDFKFANSLSDQNNTLEGKLKAARGDWKEFFYQMYIFIRSNDSRWDWLGFSVENRDDFKRMRNISAFASCLINESNTNEPHTFSGLRKMYGEFAKHAYCNDDTPPTTPFYDELNQIIVKEIERYAQQQQRPPIPSWISNPDDIRDAIAAIATIPNISKIRNPFASSEIPVEYDEVKYKFFYKLYRSQPSSSGTSKRLDLGKKSSKSEYFDD